MLQNLNKNIILITLFIFSAFTIAAQNNHLAKNVSLSADSLLTDEVLDQLAQQCNCYFTYNSNSIDKQKRIYINKKNTTLKDALNLFLPDSVYSFTEYQNQVLIIKNNTYSPPTIQKQTIERRVTGKVIDSLTKQPLPFASIAIKNISAGTIANEQGFFKLAIHDTIKNPQITVSYIGYNNVTFTKTNFTTDTTILLSQGFVPINEIIIRNNTGLYIVKKAIDNIKNNYYNKQYNFNTFYREAIKTNKTYKTYTEALLYGYKPQNNYETTKARFVLNTGRIFNSTQNNDTLLIKLSGGIDACNQLDIVNTLPDFFNKNSETRYSYKNTDIIVWDNQLVYVVSFKPLPYINDALYQGKLYINLNNYALAGADFSFKPEKMKRLGGMFIVRKSKKIKVKPVENRYTVSYSPINGTYFPNHIRGQLIINVKKRQHFFSQNYQMFFEMAYTQIDTLNITKPKFSKSIKTNSIFADLLYNYSTDNFWQNTTIINPEEYIINALSKQGLKIENEFFINPEP